MFCTQNRMHVKSNWCAKILSLVFKTRTLCCSKITNYGTENLDSTNSCSELSFRNCFLRRHCDASRCFYSLRNLKCKYCSSRLLNNQFWTSQLTPKFTRGFPIMRLLCSVRWIFSRARSVTRGKAEAEMERCVLSKMTVYVGCMDALVSLRSMMVPIAVMRSLRSAKAIIVRVCAPQRSCGALPASLYIYI